MAYTGWMHANPSMAGSLYGVPNGPFSSQTVGAFFIEMDVLRHRVVGGRAAWVTVV